MTSASKPGSIAWRQCIPSATSGPPFVEAARTPRQRFEADDTPGALEPSCAGLEGLHGFDWLHVVARFDQIPEPDRESDPMTRRPLLLAAGAERIGVFATRHPERPNRLALSLIRVQAIEGRIIHFTGVDLADRTPVLDIKPFEARIDVPDYQAGVPWIDAIRSGSYDTTNATRHHPSPRP